MTDRELKLQKEVERLQKKVRELSEAYNRSTCELNELKSQKTSGKRVRPGIRSEEKVRIVCLYQQGKTMREIARETGKSLGAVQKILAKVTEESRMIYIYMDREKVSTVLDVCGATQKVSVYNFTDDMVSRAFGINENPDWKDFEEFLETRCMPRTRYGIREELKVLSMENYDPFLIVEKTEGRVHGDGQYLVKMDRKWVDEYNRVMRGTGNSERKKRYLMELLLDMTKGAEE